MGLGGNTTCSLMILGFLLFTILHLFPRCLAARNLQDIPPSPTGQGKSIVEGSPPGHASSATDDSAPGAGVINRPPTSFYKSVSSHNSSGSQTVTTNTNGVISNSTKKWEKEQRDVNWNGHRYSNTTGDVTVSNNNGVNGGGQSQEDSPMAAPEVEYKAPEEPPITFPPPFPPFQDPFSTSPP